MLETLDYTIRIGSTPTFLYFDLYCTVLYCTVLYCTVLYCTQYCIALHCIALHCIALHCIALHCIALLYCIVLYCIVLYCIVLYCIVLYCIVLYCIVLYCKYQIIQFCKKIHVSKFGFMFSLHSAGPRYLHLYKAMSAGWLRNKTTKNAGKFINLFKLKCSCCYFLSHK